MIGLTAAVAEAFRSLHTRVVTAPWVGPNGETWELEIRPHGDPEYQKALAALGVEPLSVEEREAKRPKGWYRAMVQGTEPTEEEQAAAAEIDRELEEVRTAGFPTRTYPVTYAHAEAAEAAPAVRDHLTVSVWTVTPPSCGDEPECRKAADREEVGQWFASETPLPRQLPATSGDAIPQGVYLGGVPEGVAVTLFILRESLKEHEFLERIAPLSSSSASTPDGADTTLARPASKPESVPSSPAEGAAAPTGNAPAPAPSGTLDTVVDATGPTTLTAVA